MTTYYEAEVIIGLEDIAITELQTLRDMDLESIQQFRAGFIRFRFEGKVKTLHTLRSIIAIYAIHHFDIPRPKAILGHQNFTQLTLLLNQQLNNWRESTKTFGIGAAGSDSSVFRRIKQDISGALNIQLAEDEKGELFIRFMPARDNSGWEVLIRTTQKPLSARDWRINNIPGALNATVAYAMTQFASPKPHDNILNLCSGTATILIEQASLNLNTTLIAIDNDISTVKLANTNIQASDSTHTINQILANAQQTPFLPNQFDVIYADLPFGHHMGSHDENEWLYPAILSESERIARRRATFVVITHEINLFEQCVALTNWTIKQARQINLSGLHPQIFVLERN